MKKYFFYAAAAIALASCSNNEFFGDSPTAVGKGKGEISFSTRGENMTRAEDFTGSKAAEKLNNNFIVYGFKYTGSEAINGATTDQPVFDNYNVNYTSGTANTTESNTAGWEYVGLTPHSTSSATEQTIKYWDWSAGGYVFSAVSGLGITAEKIKTTPGDSKYDKGWTVSIPAGGSLSDLYASMRVPVTEKLTGDVKFGSQVNLKFYNLATKIRFAVYETIPGYSVKINKFYYDTTTPNTTNFAIDGSFVTLNATQKTDLTVTYNNGENNTVENTPKVTYTPGDSEGNAKQATYMIFGANIQATDAIGTTSPEATYDDAGKEYTMILPYNNTTGMSLKVDYTLTSTDGSDEEIHVYGATAKVPANFTNWKENFAYTYIFKISDNSNGSTSTDPSHPTGLYPITFDAVVVADEDGIQETITSVSDPSITTYQKGVVVTKNDEYVAGNDIYFENGTANISNYKVYEVHNYGDIEGITEEVVANYLQNFCVLTEVTVTKADGTTNDGKFIPLSDGTYLVKAANEAAKFTPEAGKVYAICDEASPTKHYKVVKVAGEETAPTFTLASSVTGITAIAGTATLTLQQGSTGVLGAVPCFKVTTTDGNVDALKIVDGANAGEYTVSLDQDAVAAGKAEGTYTIQFNDGPSVSIFVGLGYNLTKTAITMDAGDEASSWGATPEWLQLMICGSQLANASKAEIVNNNKGVTVTPVGNYFKIAVASDCVAGDKTITISGQTLTLKVKNYRFASSAVTLVKPYNTGVGTSMNLWDEEANDLAAGIDANDLTVDKVGLAVANVGGSATGQYSFGSTDGGVYTVSYKNTKAKCVVTVEEYEMNDASVKKSTGKATLTVTLNEGSYNASASALKIYDSGSNDVTSNFTVTTNGKNIVLSNVKSTLPATTYTAQYTVGTTIVAQSTITVTE